MKTVTILGSTGSVGQSSLDVIKAHPSHFRIEALTAHRNLNKIVAQARDVKPEHVVIGDESLYKQLKDRLDGTGIQCHAGYQALNDIAARPVDIAVAAITGMAGLSPLMAAMGRSRAIAVANKEPLVAAGTLITETARKTGTKLLPVDSEHNAIFQVFETRNKDNIESLILTASGGPFLKRSRKSLADVTPEEAVKHPNWSMGAKISVDSATMMNKALEVIEAHYLFAMPPASIAVMIHPQSIVHSMVSYADGSILAQLGAPDMRTPIVNALGWPERLATPGEKLDWTTLRRLDFETPDNERFPALSLAYSCLREGQAACLVMNAANEIAVAAFLEGRIAFHRIEAVVEAVLENTNRPPLNSLDDIVSFDKAVREAANTYIIDLNKKTSAVAL